MKRIYAFIPAVVLSLALVACSGNMNDADSNSESTSSVNSESQDVNEVISEDIDQEEINKEYIAPEESTDEDASMSPIEEDTSEVNRDIPILTIGETVSVDEKCEFYLDYVNITDDVMPPKPGSWYSHYEADDGKVYVDVCVAYKNLATRNIDADEVMTGKLIYSGKYEYKGFSMIERDSRSDFTYSNITSIAPLSTEYVHYLFSVPEEVQTSENAVDVILAIADGEYKILVKEGAIGTPASSDSDSVVQKTGGEIALDEIISTNNSEFFVDYANITSDVMPPKPGSWYSHYEADDGKVYVDFCVGYKNTSGKSVRADDVISANLIYADKYEYTGFSMIEQNSRSDFTYSNITSISPLNTEYVHYLFSVPEEVESSSDTVVISFKIDGNNYTYIVR